MDYKLSSITGKWTTNWWIQVEELKNVVYNYYKVSSITDDRIELQNAVYFW